jgi:DNA repair protein RadC
VQDRRCEILGPALREGAAHLILAHNHPSGDPIPSKEDIHLTRQLAEGARLLGIRVHDHVIIGNGTESFVSLAQRGLL